MEATPAAIQNCLELLRKTSQRISRATNGVDEPRLHALPDNEEWSANDILAHLRSCADVWGDSIERMLVEDKQTLPYIHPRQWIKKTDYPKLPFRESFRSFEIQRKKLLKLLESLSFEDWSCSATIKGREHTVFTQVRRMAKHENEHCGQIEAMLK